MLWSAGVHPLWLLGQVGAGVGAVALLWSRLPDYVRQRFLVVFDHDLDPLGHRVPAGAELAGHRLRAGHGAGVPSGDPNPERLCLGPTLPGTRISSSPWRGRSWAWWAAWPFWPCWAPSCCGACGWPAGAGTLCSPRWPWGWRGCSVPKPFECGDVPVCGPGGGGDPAVFQLRRLLPPNGLWGGGNSAFHAPGRAGRKRQLACGDNRA